MNANLIRIIPLLIMLALALALSLGLFNSDHPDRMRENTLIGYDVAPFDIPSIDGPTVRFAPKSWRGNVIVLNVFASWCQPCAVEHPVLMRLAQTHKVNLYGLAWKDKPQALSAWLNQNGNPYQQIGVDQFGQTTIPMALTGVPETFIINKDGKIFYHRKSPLTDEMVNSVILPLVDRLNRGDVSVH